MTIEQTVEIPPAAGGCRRLIINVPPETPAGPVVLTFTPARTAKSRRLTGRQREALAKCRGIAKGILSSEDILENRRTDKAQERRLFRPDGSAD